MIPSKLLPLIVYAFALFAAAGCDQPAQNNCDPFQCDGAVCPVNHASQSGYEFSGGNTSAAAAIVNQKAAAEVKGDAPAVDSLNEAKTGNCPDCVTRPAIMQPTPPGFGYVPRPVPQSVISPQNMTNAYGLPPLRPGEVLLNVGPGVPVHRHPAAIRPATIPRPAPNYPVKVDARGETIREGAFACSRCGQPTVGDQWHQLWADDDTPLTCLCERCWHTITPADREAYLQRYARGQRGGNLSPIVQAAIIEASK